MKNSRMSAEWIAQAVARNPIVKLPNGNFRTCPVRLAFPDLFKPSKAKGDDGAEKQPTFGCTVLFPPGADQGIRSVLYAAWYEAVKTAHPKNIGADGKPFGLHWPLHDAGEKQQYAGYTPGLFFTSVSSQYKPQVVDPAMNPIVDEARVYPGVWAILGLNLYTYKNKKTGAGFGLQTVMIIADDEKLSSGGPDINEVFSGVDIDAAYNPIGAFDQAPGGSLMAPAQTIHRAPAMAPAMDWDPING